ncbi:nitroreductase family protein [Nisaea acidiphila]|uniref:Nitroreductase family protein n=1 Tax=Nisaea acidiphila TaxID=1862145 RepID=A0A9J7AXF9_9PROT|nr:nitroreductase family protein [Nisaea acidiphila]UUX52071.1 nitroreductase family protein [Nisaea acidiphila]
MSSSRLAGHPIESLFLDRWSPRSFLPESMPQSDLETVLEAARWAPSAFNIQPWHFLYAHRDSAHWQPFVSLLDEFNRLWAADASVLVLLLSDSVMPGEGGRPDRISTLNSFDAGAAWVQLALQATALGYHAHAMAGIDRDRVRRILAVPDRFKVEIAIALGRRGPVERLAEPLRAREAASGRRPLAEIATPGMFPSERVA